MSVLTKHYFKLFLVAKLLAIETHESSNIDLSMGQNYQSNYKYPRNHHMVYLDTAIGLDGA